MVIGYSNDVFRVINMLTYITSDVHLGLPQCRTDDFLAFLAGLPPGARLILNGDTITHFHSDATLSDEHKQVVSRIREEAERREVIWLHGNNDKKIKLGDPGRIVFARDYSIGKRLYVSHGDNFDYLMPAARAILIPVRLMYYSAARIKGSKMHVAEYAKRYSRLYRVLCRHVASNAVRYARRHGYAAAACGHTHFTEDSVISGIRYLNTGSWTEPNTAYIVVDDRNIRLHKAELSANLL